MNDSHSYPPRDRHFRPGGQGQRPNRFKRPGSAGFGDSRAQGKSPHSNRFAREGHPDRPSRFGGQDRPPRREGDRPPGGPRRFDRFAKGGRSDRPSRFGGQDRPPRREGDRPPGGPRRFDRFAKGGRPDRPSRFGGQDRPPRREGDRPPGGPRRFDRFAKGGRSDRPSRFGGQDRPPRREGDRPPGGPRRFDRFAKGGRPDRPSRFGGQDRPPRREGDRPPGGPRRFDRFAKGGRPDRPSRFGGQDRPPRREGDRPPGGPRRFDRFAKGGRPDRPSRFGGQDRPPRREGDRPPGGPRRFDRFAKGGHPRNQRSDHGERSKAFPRVEPVLRPPTSEPPPTDTPIPAPVMPAASPPPPLPANGALFDIPFGRWDEALAFESSQGYRVRQVQEWAFHHRATSFGQMSTLPEDQRQRLDGLWKLRTLELQGKEESQSDGTVRYLFKAADGSIIPTVFLPFRNEEGERHTLCLSTQVGCAWGCRFCASGQHGLRRNLTPTEIIEQVLLIEADTGLRAQSLLFMGMGEPLANFNALVVALGALRSPLAFNYGARHVTISTCGLVPEIRRLAREAPRVNLALSLHAADDETRRRLLPKAARWELKELLRAAWEFQKLTGDSRVGIEYIMLKGINDSERTAKRLSNLLRGRDVWINLIVYNPVSGFNWEEPEEEAVKIFARILKERGFFVHVRKPQGRDISAGCGQLGKPESL